MEKLADKGLAKNIGLRYVNLSAVILSLLKSIIL